jgi:hypothetical protein
VDAGTRRNPDLPDSRAAAQQAWTGRWNGWFVLITYLIPIAYCLVASVGTVVFGFGGFPNDGFVRTVTDTMGLSGHRPGR